MKSAFHVSYELTYEIMPKREGTQVAKKRVWKKQRKN